MRIITAILVGMLMLTPQQVYARKGVVSSLVGAAIGAVVGKAVGVNLTSKEIQLDEPALRKVAEYVNQKLPMVLDADTRLDSTMAGPGRQFTYIYSITHYSSSEVDPVMFSRDVAPTILNRACSASDLQIFFQKEVTVIFLYLGNDGKYVTKIEMTPAVCRLRDVPVKTDPSGNLTAEMRAKLKKFVGAEADEIEITRCAQKVEKIISGLLKISDYRKIAIATKVKMAVKVSKQNVINMITNSYPGIITDRMAASIYDALAEQS
ncbi:MAG: hypothetical protein PHY54_01180 [Methylococcales bacterium]|nr:hypothetical protein [Methylococcales bacterium]